MERHADTFVASGEDGKNYTIHIIRRFRDVGTRDDPDAVVEMPRSLQTSEGYSVNYLSKGRYQIVSTGVLLHSDDPNVP